MKRFYLLALLLSPLITFAQSHYKSGYVVTIKGDTLRGFINLKEWGHNPKNIEFKRSLNDKAQQFGLQDIKYFEATGYQSYRQFKVSISLNPIELTSHVLLTDTTTSTDNVFLQILATGKNVSFYSYADGIKQRLYIKENGTTTPTELLYGIYEDADSPEKTVEKKTYQAQLEQLAFKYNMGDDKLITQIQQAEYREDPVGDIIAKINGNTSVRGSNVNTDGTKVRFFAGLALISNTVKANEYYQSPTSTCIAPKITAGADLIVNPAVGHLVFRLELAYYSDNYSFDDKLDKIFGANNTAYYLVKVKRSVISVTPQVLFNIYNGEKVKVFVDLGYCLNFPSSPPDQLIPVGGSSAPAPDYGLGSKPSYSTFQFKAGLSISKRLEIYGAYLPNGVISDAAFTNYANSYSNSISSYQFGVNYYFGKGAR